MKNDAKVALTVIGVSFGILVYNVLSYNFGETKVRIEQETKMRAGELEPRIITERDGCKVYAFRPHINASMHQ
jgi:hypothetical protein